MTDEPRALSVVPEPVGDAHGLERYEPRDLKQLVWFAGELAKVGMFTKTDKDGNPVPMNAAETFFVIAEGVEMGLRPLAALRNIYMIEDRYGRRTTIPRADLIAARIQADERTEEWNVHDETPGIVTINAKRRGRGQVSVTLELKDISERDKNKWARGYLDAQDMLYNRAVRKIARRFFRDMVLGLGNTEGDAEIEPTKIIDVSRVEERLAPAAGEMTWPCTTDGCDGRMTLESSNRGGAYLWCRKCSSYASPPQEVRDLIRGTPAALSIAAAETPEEVMPSADAGIAPSAPHDVTPPPSDAPVDAAENEGGAFRSTADADAPENAAESRDEASAVADPAMIQWRARSRSAISKYLGEHRTPETGREQSVKALKDAGWDELSGVSLGAFLRDASDETIATLIGTFAIDVP